MKNVVLKLGGSVITDLNYKKDLLKQIVELSTNGYCLYIVHGGGKEINKYLDLCQIQSEFIQGLRKTNRDAIDIIAMVLNGKVNKEIVHGIQQLGGRAVGLSGLDGHSVIVDKVEMDNIDLGYVGYPKKIDTVLLTHLSEQGYIVVLSCIGTDLQDMYNINADHLAIELAKSIQSDYLVYVTDVEGVLNLSGETIREINAQDMMILEENRIITVGMIPKLHACLEGIKAGIQSVYILNGKQENSLIQAIMNGEIQGTWVR